MELFAELYSTRAIGKPVAEAFRAFEYLHRYEPDATFLLNTRAKSNWMTQRLTWQSGYIMDKYRAQMGLAPDDVLQHWSNVWDKHHSDVQAYFAKARNAISVLDVEKMDAAQLSAALRTWKPFDQVKVTPL